jgi:hypothetical protein
LLIQIRQDPNQKAERFPVVSPTFPARTLRARVTFVSFRRRLIVRSGAMGGELPVNSMVMENSKANVPQVVLTTHLASRLSLSLQVDQEQGDEQGDHHQDGKEIDES